MKWRRRPSQTTVRIAIASIEASELFFRGLGSLGLKLDLDFEALVILGSESRSYTMKQAVGVLLSDERFSLYRF